MSEALWATIPLSACHGPSYCIKSRRSSVQNFESQCVKYKSTFLDAKADPEKQLK